MEPRGRVPIRMPSTGIHNWNIRALNEYVTKLRSYHGNPPFTDTRTSTTILLSILPILTILVLGCKCNSRIVLIYVESCIYYMRNIPATR